MTAAVPPAPLGPTERYLNDREGRLLLLSVLAMASLIFAFVGYVNAKPAVGAGGATIDPALSDAGRAVYNGAVNCGSCHGSRGGGGVGPKLSDGAVTATFPDPLDQVRWVLLGSTGGADLYTAAGKTPKGGMPAFEGKLTLTEVVHLVLYERQTLGGTPLADDAAAWQDLSVLLDEFPGAGFSAAEVEAVLAEIGPPPTADAATGDGDTDGAPDAGATDGGAAIES
ncbi:MAG: c-type cytochrome [Acidimicrobiales bacterium]